MASASPGAVEEVCAEFRQKRASLSSSFVERSKQAVAAVAKKGATTARGNRGIRGVEPHPPAGPRPDGARAATARATPIDPTTDKDFAFDARFSSQNMSEQRTKYHADAEYMTTKENQDMVGGLRKIGTGLNKGWRRGALHTVELDFKDWHKGGVRWDPTPRFGYCNGVTRELEKRGYEHMGPGYYDATNPNFTPLHEANLKPSARVWSHEAECHLWQGTMNSRVAVMNDKEPRFTYRSGFVGFRPETTKKGYEHLGPGYYPEAYKQSAFKASRNAKIVANDGSLFYGHGITEDRIEPIEKTFEAGHLSSYLNMESDAKEWLDKGVPFSKIPRMPRPATACITDGIDDHFVAHERMDLSDRLSNIHTHGLPSEVVRDLRSKRDKTAEEKEIENQKNKGLQVSKVARFNRSVYSGLSDLAYPDFAHIGPGSYELEHETVKTRTLPESKTLFGSNMTSKTERFTYPKAPGLAQPMFGKEHPMLLARRRQLMAHEERRKEGGRRKCEEERLMAIYRDQF